MPHSIRLLEFATQNAPMNMATDESIMKHMAKGNAPPTLRFYRWNPSAVSIGVFQGMTEEVDLDYCRDNGIDYVRRITGGGAVYHDYNGEITYSIILPKDHPLVKPSIIESYKSLCSGIIEGLANLGIDAEFRPINDIVVGEKKISGNAQTRRYSCMLQHGTILLDLDVETMFSVLKVPKEKISDKMISDVNERVTSVRDLLGEGISFDDLYNALVSGFSKGLDLEIEQGVLSQSEKEMVESLIESRYASDEWNLSR